MTASVLKQDPNTKRFKRTLIYFDTHTQYIQIFDEIPFVKPQNDTCNKIKSVFALIQPSWMAERTKSIALSFFLEPASFCGIMK